MRSRFRLLILGGTAEARALAAALAGRPGLEVVTSLAGRTRRPARPAGGLRVGGFGGIDGLARWLADHAVDAVIDATHPFAPALAEIADVEAAAGRVAALGERPLLAVGRQSLAPFAGRLRGSAVVRVFEPPAETALPGARGVVDRGPWHAAGAPAPAARATRRGRRRCCAAKASIWWCRRTPAAAPATPRSRRRGRSACRC